MSKNLRREVSQSSNEFRSALEADLLREIRSVRDLSEAVDQAVSDLLGITRADARCLDIIDRHGSITAGDLARESRLSTGAVTALLDRLERANAVRRVADATDRRRVLVELTPEARQRASHLRGSAATTAEGLVAKYTDHELAVILDFLRRNRELSRTELVSVKERVDAVKDAARRAKQDVKQSKAEVKRAAKALKSEVKQAVKGKRV